MKRSIGLALVSAALAWSVPAAAQESAGDFGAGVYIGVPFGATAKYLLTNDYAVSAALGAQGGDFDMHADFVTHLRDIVPQPAQGKLPLHLGLGLKINAQRDTFFGIRFVGGGAYLLPRHPIEIFAELVPVLRMAPSVGSNLDGGVGLRYYFGRAR